MAALTSACMRLFPWFSSSIFLVGPHAPHPHAVLCNIHIFIGKCVCVRRRKFAAHSKKLEDHWLVLRCSAAAPRPHHSPLVVRLTWIKHVCANTLHLCSRLSHAVRTCEATSTAECHVWQQIKSVCEMEEFHLMPTSQKQNSFILCVHAGARASDVWRTR